MGVTICIGDIHGHIDKLERLWVNLQHELTESFEDSTVIFLGDYCDRGPDTAKVIDFLVSLPERYPSQKHVFLCGNHDFAFAAFLRLLPPPPDSFSISDTWKEYHKNEEREGWWSGEGYEEMHIQGRRWAGNIRDQFNVKKGTTYKGSIYDAAPTFESYGVAHGDGGLIRAVPERHNFFLQDLVWVHEEEDVDTGDPEMGRTKLIAVHAGLEITKSVEEQLKVLYNRDVTFPRIEALSGRKNVWEIPKTHGGFLLMLMFSTRIHTISYYIYGSGCVFKVVCVSLGQYLRFVDLQGSCCACPLGATAASHHTGSQGHKHNP